MTIAFDRPIGSPADVKELEYISALHQTEAKSLRANGSVQAVDIQHFLSSRHGLAVDLGLIQTAILDELAGDLEAESDDVLDICQIVGILLIPRLLQRRGAKDGSPQEEEDLIARVLDIIRKDVHSMTFTETGPGTSEQASNKQDSPVLSRSLLRSMLECYGEFDAPDELLDNMIQQARGDGMSSSEVLWNVDALHRALTSDVERHYSTEWDTRTTTHFEDAGIFRPVLLRSTSTPKNKASRTLHIEDDDDGDDEETPTGDTSGPSQRSSQSASKQAIRPIPTASYIDNVADTFRSQTFTVLLWACFVISYFSYLADVNVNFGRIDCGESFGCKVANGITNWLVIFLQLSLIGTAFIVLGSAGNSLKKSKNEAVLGIIVGIVAMVVLSVLPFVYSFNTQFFNTSKDDETQTLSFYLALTLGCILIVFQLLQLCSEVFDLSRFKGCLWFDVFLTAGIRKMERRTKQAAAFKIHRMVQNALDLHANAVFSHSASAALHKSQLNQSTALINYQTMESHYERVGGMWWGWKRVWNKTIHTEEGVWLHSRLIACVASQLIVCLVLIFTFSYLMIYVEDLATYIEDNTPEGETPIVYSWEVAVAGSLGIIAGLGACFCIAIVYIPSFVSTALQFRSGVIPSLCSRDFLVYRVALDQTGIIFGSSFWGAVYTAAVMALIVGGVTFFVVWHITRNFALTILAQIIGIICTVVLRLVILIVLRASFYAGFYRKKPAPANCMNIVLECWNLGLSAGYMLARTAKLMIAAATFLGRMDTPFLAPGAGVIGPVILDAYPVAFRKDLLVHEAHRHPYLERLGTMYMLKLKFGNDFASRAGSCWRLLFVLALMPWLRRYRVRFVGDALERELAKVNEMLSEEQDDHEDTPGDRRKVLEHRRDSLRMIKDTEKLAVNREELLEREVEMLKDEVSALREEIFVLKRTRNGNKGALHNEDGTQLRI